MFKFLFRHAIPLACAWLALSPSAKAAEEKPAAATTPSSAPAPFDQYRPWRDSPVADWRQANERVGEVGGWRTYLRESQPSASGDSHGSHGHHGH
jgi:hypothetical protein